MELRELGDRLVRRHARLILAVLIVGVLGGFALRLGDKPQYQASAVFVIGAQDPQSAEEASVLADTARGIATGPQLVARAISEAGVARNVAAVAGAENVQTLGISGVLTLSVTDPNPRVAVKLANTLARGVVNTRIALNGSGLASSLRALDQQEASTNTQIGQLSAQTRTATGVQLTQLEVRLTTLQGEALQIAAQRDALEAQEGPKATVLDDAVSASALSGRGLVDGLLGGLLGLVVGIALASVREVVRPSLVGAAAISQAMGAPLLGDMSSLPDSWTPATLADAGSYIELAAYSQDVQEVTFADLDRNGRREARMRVLEGPLHRLSLNGSRPKEPSAESYGAEEPYRSVAQASTAVGRRRRSFLATTDLLASTQENGAELALGAEATLSGADQNGDSSPRIGLVVAVPRVVKAADLNAVTNLTRISGWTLLGAIVYSPPRKPIIPAWTWQELARFVPRHPFSQQGEVNSQ